MQDDPGRGGVVHIVAPFGRDAASIASVLDGAGLATRPADTLDDLAAALDDQAGVVLITEEAIARGTDCLLQRLSAQPAWSDLPVILLRSPRAHRRSPFDSLLPRTVNVVELDRPLGGMSLLSAVQGALRAREKQFLVRDQMRALADSRSALERSAKAALEASRQHALELETVVAERTRELEAQMAAREASEAALRQSQKMEAIGQLTGGIAHDFNNMLTGILSALDIVRMRLELGRTDDLERFLDAATTSSQRAAALTQRLLAFSRRQSLDARPVELNALVGAMQHLLRSTLGESVRIRTEEAPAPLHAALDTNQFESALLNLAINARDAMPNGGELALRTFPLRLADGERASVPAGDYAVVAVSDTGSGMPPEVVERAFEPFFTTKPIGKGTGLGMSMVYGFMQQSGGHIAIDSTPGQGTTISLFIPQVEADAEPEPAADAAPVALGAGQSILVVEDDPQVRMLVTVVLEDLGYTVEVVGDADGALPVLASTRRLDLLVTDVGLPGMNGRQLAEIARQSRSELPVLFMTGYAEKAQERSAFLEPGMSMIAKPFLLEAFSDAVRSALADAVSDASA
ncbi:ATP-binding protein [Stenotrophomonas sp. SORGH_AS_0282]|uniref:ATP-binding protein n=1 Tax=Stenotrophomonas sp. SORGH_AS_0282 TaxID=3041763 RepID=UPI0027891370|nr:ATP-binding protein [Stenotrophomonas sp. SORGH_AS_0282]MDQ1063458.1 signal transduction histidine kinase/ActR/RegA family two-component response regulator [Stenotrophomonas sp. SORGH_AS_0282]MDQ1188181.1 signal transduction histidine kinase/ActR/RegA family two-component response regulator [Stenotrophomonas sp. SORGH_AS_0282]